MKVLDLERFRKVQKLATGGATEGERSAARSRMETMAAAAGVSVEPAIAHADQQPQQRNFFELPYVAKEPSPKGSVR